MDFFQSLSGRVEVTLTTADIPGALDAITEAGIQMHHVSQTDEVTILLTISRGKYRLLKEIAKRRGYTLDLVGKTGLYWHLKAGITRPVLVWGIALLLLFAALLPTRIFFVEVDGNTTIPDRKILEAAEGCGISFGASRREVRSEQVKNALLQAMPELQWAGVNTYGCLAVISVRERTAVEKTESLAGIYHIVALRDGVITSCTATSGNLLCRPGQAVTEGEILISGYTDCGLTITVSQAEGEIYARTTREIRVISPTDYETKTAALASKQNFSLILGKKRINLYKDSGIWGGVCDRIYEEYYVTLPGGFRLPIALAVDRYTAYDTTAGFQEESEIRERMESWAKDYIRRQMVAGSMDVGVTQWTKAPGQICLTGKYICTEMIGKVQREQIGEYHGENS